MSGLENKVDDEIKSIKRVFQESVDAWNRGNMDEHLKSYANLETVRYISSGTITMGKPAIAEAFKSRFPSPDLMGTLALKNLNVEVITATDALFMGEFYLERESAQASGAFTGRMQKFADGWAIVLDHSSSRA